MLSQHFLALPSRAQSAPGGKQFALSIRSLELKEREAAIENQIFSGNVPWRRFVPIEWDQGGHHIRVHVMPDYIAVGGTDDAFYVPLTPYTAQRIATRLGCLLPTPLLVDKIFELAKERSVPKPMTPGPQMTTVPAFLTHSQLLKPPLEGVLAAGKKKDIVICKSLESVFGKVAIYGWHNPDGKAIQPLYLGHTATWADYSHGVRLVRKEVEVDGRKMSMSKLLANPSLCFLLSKEGPVTQPRYRFAEFPVDGLAQIKVPPRETLTEFSSAKGVRAVVHAPRQLGRDVQVVVYALPNGNSIEQTFGRQIQEGMDWHFDIQHIAAQTRWLWQTEGYKNLVVVYLESPQKSWPAWCQTNDPRSVLEEVKARFAGKSVKWTWASHSGGGAFVLKLIKSLNEVPPEVERMVFLDSNYAYDTPDHFTKLKKWLELPDRYLTVFAYDDANGLLNGKPFVSATGGTWGRTQLMLKDFGMATYPQDLACLKDARGRAILWLKQNPDHKIFHTVQVEKNGFIEGMLAGTARAGKGYTYFGDRAYTAQIRF